jgi:aminobenzoyl-glutamate utilization protein B
MADYTKIEKEVDQLSDAIWDLSSKVWEYAEIGFEEVQSSAYSSELLEKNEFKISDQGIGGIDTSWIATWSNGSGGPVVGLLVEFDALAGLGNDTQPKQTPAKSGITIGHGCGHNLICSTSIGAAMALKNHMVKEKIAGTIKVFGCPAEEFISGKNFMAQAGAFDGLDVCMHNHPGPVNTVWNFHSAAAIDLWVEWKGVTAHAGAAPWEGRSALHALEVFLVAANMMREQMLPTARLHYQILNGGAAVNVIPDYAKVLIRYRGPSQENVEKYRDWLIEMAKGASLTTQTKETVTVLSGIHDCLQNDAFADVMNNHMADYFPLQYTDEEQDFAKKIQKEMSKPEVGMPDKMLPMPVGVEVGGSSDVGDVSWNVPTMGAVYASWPAGISPHQWGCTASNGMSIGKKATINAAKVLATTGLDLLTNPKLLKDIKAEFDKRRDGKNYHSLNKLTKPIGGSLDKEHRHVMECCIHAAMEHFGTKEEVGA